ncbi:thrombopoietin [Dendrobates tinctorius]|uniref:thrombopoietin n=1 Tax=Dendrobates tinctorius TaxID=92724 RepID=UPI003CC937B5
MQLQDSDIIYKHAQDTRKAPGHARKTRILPLEERNQWPEKFLIEMYYHIPTSSTGYAPAYLMRAQPGICLLIILVLSPGMSMTSKIICDHRFILVFMNRTRTMERMAAQCEDQNIQVTPIIIPNVEVKVAHWKNMTVSQQGNEVFSHLILFLNVTQHVKTTACMSQQLKLLTRTIRAVQGLVNKAWRQTNNDTDLAQEASFVPSDVPSTVSLDIKDIFHRFIKLLQGKITFLLNGLCDVSSR